MGGNSAWHTEHTKAARNQDIQRRVAAGERTAEVARRYKISKERVRQLCLRVGLLPREMRRVQIARSLEAMVAAARGGLTLAETAERTGYCYTWVRKKLCELGVKCLRQKGSGSPRFDHAEIARLRKQGMLFREIVKKVGCAHITAARICHDAGLTRPRRVAA